MGGDIAEMYHQVKVRKEDQDYQRFFCIEPSSVDLVGYVMTVMTFGVTSSHSCPQYVKVKTQKNFKISIPKH